MTELSALMRVTSLFALLMFPLEAEGACLDKSTEVGKSGVSGLPIYNPVYRMRSGIFVDLTDISPRNYGMLLLKGLIS